jgi:hypothetical protein
VNNVKFIEVGYVVNGAKAPAAYRNLDKQKFIFWVSASSNYVEIFDFYKPMFERYPSSEKFTSWMKPLDYFTAGDKSVKGIPAVRLITLSSSQVMDEKFKVIAHVRPNTLLGQLIMTLDTGKGRFHKFKTVDNTERWVSANHIKMQ